MPDCFVRHTFDLHAAALVSRLTALLFSAGLSQTFRSRLLAIAITGGRLRAVVAVLGTSSELVDFLQKGFDLLCLAGKQFRLLGVQFEE